MAGPTGNLPPIPGEMIESIQEGRACVFVGAGLSAGAGYLPWRNFLKSLLDRAHERNFGVTDTQVDELKGLIDQGDKLLMVAEELKERFGKERFEDDLVKIFGEKKDPTSAHTKLMNVPFRFAVTTNYDLLLERAYVAKHSDFPSAYTHMQPAEIAEALWRNEYFILKAHGDVKNRASIVITERDYRDIVFRSHGYRSAMGAILTTNTMIFLGVSLDDPELKLLLAFLHDAFHGGTTHYALVPKSQFSATVVNRWRKDYSIECLCFTPSEGYPEVEQFIDALPKIE